MREREKKRERERPEYTLTDRSVIFVSLIEGEREKVMIMKK